MAAATDSHLSPAAGTQTNSAESSSAASSEAWSPSKQQTDGKKPAWSRPSAASPAVDAGSWPALNASSRSSSSAPINPAIRGDDGEFSMPVRAPVKLAPSEPPAVRGDHGPRPRSYAPRGGYSHHHRRSYNHHGNTSRPRRDNYGHNYHHPRPHLGPPPFFPQPIPLYSHQHFGNYPAMIGYGDAAPFQIWYVPTMPTVTYPAPPQHVGRSSLGNLRSAVLRQIEYYFSDSNLCSDVYLRQNMDEEGWVSVSLIASFKKMRELNTDIPFILNTVRNSNVLEVKDHKIRTRIGPLRWILPQLSATEVEKSIILESEMKKMQLNEGSNSEDKISCS